MHTAIAAADKWFIGDHSGEDGLVCYCRLFVEECVHFGVGYGEASGGCTMKRFHDVGQDFVWHVGDGPMEMVDSQ
jgi:hypothetical protein